ncbi:(2Fe-2S)-binding protein [Aureimonas sp. AU40]|uniref:(2Fe-2S)-binding protein n=1 Tax=Aureimonas sp. AU40 TaxID=1637747 RepID=UPI000782C957|nr:(2Fe-2S)-binding protein [Aureimonas sp. AU40]
MVPRFRRVAETGRRSIEIEVDGQPVSALEGDSVMAAVLLSRGTLRQSEFGDGPRAGFCLMGACQDCWVWTPDGDRLRACTTPAEPGLRIVTSFPSEDAWPLPA